MALDTVHDYIVSARTFLQDEMEPPRYTDEEIKEALGFGLMEARSKRPEFFIGREVPDIDRTTGNTTVVDFDIQYRTALLFYVIGTVMLRDEEESAKADAAGYLNRFVAKVLSLAS